MDLEQVIALIREGWPARMERGLVTHVHRNYLTLPDGSVVHLRLLIQKIPQRDALSEDQPQISQSR